MKFTKFSNFQFMVPKKYMSGLPYLKSLSGMILELALFCEIWSQNMKTSAKYLGNTIRELFPSRHYVERSVN